MIFESYKFTKLKTLHVSKFTAAPNSTRLQSFPNLATGAAVLEKVDKTLT